MFMSRQFIADLQARDSVDEIYRVADKQVRSNRQGNDYLLLQLMDRTGQVSGLRWNAGQSLYETFQKGDFLRVLGTTQLHNGMLQIIVQDFETVHPTKVNHDDFSNSDPQEIEQLLVELKEKLGSVRNPHLKRLMAAYMADEQLLEKLRRAPAGIKTHHAYEGGLLRHVLDLMRIAEAIAPNYAQLDSEMLLVGVFLHDLGKLEELSFDGDLSYSDPGQMLGHLVQGAIELERRSLQITRESGQSLPADLLWRLQHMIVSHHGQLDHGSPKVPMTIEAIVLHYIDDMDAKVNAATELIDSDRNSDSQWTAFHPVIGRKLFKPSVRKL
jgi:3'-5' exoribonuclease